ncbi:MAG: hypothetical protein JWR24_3415 [Actinoallomurus sp.]|nr:hypothetical protein [Actinoallomurus sp.]
MNSITDVARDQQREYSQGQDRPLGSYGAALAFYGLAVGAGALIAKLGGRRPADPSLSDVVLMTVTTHKVARTLAKDPVTSPLRAPFTHYQGTAGPSELTEEVRGKGVRHVVGELLSCPFCLAQWVATAYAGGMTFSPRATRLVGVTMTAVAGADWLQLLYARLQQEGES